MGVRERRATVIAVAFTFGLDISHHQDLGLDLARCKREGISFVFLKATEGRGFTDAEFAANLAEARRAGLLVAAYHYVRGNVSAAAQVAHISRVIPKNVPVIPDTEAGGGGIALTRELIVRLRAAGYRVPLLYLPRWYWQQIGSPSMAGLPPLWASRYPDNVIGSLADEWADVPAHYWDGYAGQPVAVLQFTSSARIAGHAPIDANAYRGTPAQLAALLGGEGDDDVTAAENWGYENRERSILGDAFEHLVRTYEVVVENQRRAGVNNAALLAAIAADRDLDPDQLAAVVDQAIAKYSPTADEIAAALLPLVEDVTERVLGADNQDLAAEILRQLREALPANTEGN